MKLLIDSIKEIINNKEKNIHLMFAITVFIQLMLLDITSFQYNFFIHIIIICLMIGLFFKKELLYKRMFWAIISTLFFVSIMFNYYLVSNHLFLTFYLALLLFISLSYNVAQQPEILRFNVKLILSIMMVAAAIHKLLVPDFINGSIMKYQVSSGILFEGFTYFSSYNDIINFNNQSMQELLKSPNKSYAVNLISPINLNNFYTYFSWLIIISELMFPLFIFIKNEIVKHSFLIIFLTFLAITRDELGFFSLLCIMCYALINHDKDKYAKVYSFFYMLFFLFAISQVALGFASV